MFEIGNIRINDFPVILAPMENATDIAFRTLCRRFGADIVYTEFIAADAIIRKIAKTHSKTIITEKERPAGIQIFGKDATGMAEAARMLEMYEPDLIDINFGCPVRKIAGKGCGAGLLNDIEKMVEITRAVVNATKLPVTVKTRLGYDEKNKNIKEITLRLQDVGIKAITIHGRTRNQMYKGISDWTLIGEIKNNPKIYIPVIGNGDVTTAEKAKEMKDKYGVDAIMVGRAAIGNPWIFREIKEYINKNKTIEIPQLKEKIDICKEHLLLTIELKGEKTGILTMRKHYSKYFKNYPNFKEYKNKLLTSDSLSEIFNILNIMQKREI